ncbi:hypothetical protein N619_18160 [Ectopseudomonas oleovorans]|nr:hypothetical protein N619_18160 [Pseudomonas oleovorans]
MEICEFIAHIGKFLFGQLTGFMTMRAVVQLQQFGHFIQAEAQPLSGLDELHPRHIDVAITANTTERLIWFRQ